VLVMHDGRVAGILERDLSSQEQIMTLATGTGNGNGGNH